MSETREVRNEIFGGDAIKSQVAQSADQLKRDLGYEIPVDSVPLPSSGKVYPSDSPLHKRTTIDIRAMTAREEDILTSRALIKNGTVITELLKSCIVDKTIDVRKMLSGDRNAIMVALRITGYGAEYRVEVECPSCSEKGQQEFNLGTLPVKRLSIEPVREGENLFELQLPVSKSTVQFRFLTGADEEDISIAQERKKKIGGQIDTLVTTRLAYSIVSVNGKVEKSEISKFIRNMPARDSLTLRKFMDKTEPGVEMKGDINCRACGHIEEVQMPMGASFFWPDTGR